MEITYKIAFSRRRSISIIVSPDKGVIVRAPYGASLKTIDKFVGEKAGWIKKQTERFSSLTRINKDKKYTDGEIHLFMGREYRLKIIDSFQSSVYLHDNVMEVYTDSKDDRVNMLLERWYKKEAEKNIPAKMKELISRFPDHNFSPSQLVIRSFRSRWGSCTSKGKITISSELIKLDGRFTEYVILHELCHLKYHNHGKEYYRLLETLVPDYKAIRKELRKYITR